MNARLRRPPNRLLAVGVVGVLMATVMIAAVSFSASMSRRSGGGGGNGAMIVSDVGLSQFGNNRIRAVVEVKSNGAAVKGARVLAQLEMPNGKRFWIASESDQSGKAVRFVRISGPGTYMLSVVDVSKPNMKFDAQGSVDLDATLQVGGVDNPPTPTEEEPTATETEEEDPTATEADPTATEEDPTATEEDPTATEDDPTATEEDPTGTEVDPPSEPSPGVCDMGNVGNTWHAPGAHGSLGGHDHGDAPPQWLIEFSCENFGHTLIYGGDEGTPNENVMKHQGFKGYLVVFGNGFSDDTAELYIRMHAMTTPMGRTGRFHSYEVYARDESGNVSFWQGWVDFGTGNLTTPYNVWGACGDESQRPIITGGLVDGCVPFGGFENWYGFTRVGWSWDFGMNLKSTYYQGQDINNLSEPMDPSTWIPYPQGNFGLERRIEAAWYRDRTDTYLEMAGVDYDQWFCLSQASGAIFGVERAADCPAGTLPQYIASTMPQISFPENSVQRIYPGAEVVQLPN